jgi:hypothetical protein
MKTDTETRCYIHPLCTLHLCIFETSSEHLCAKKPFCTAPFLPQPYPKLLPPNDLTAGEAPPPPPPLPGSDVAPFAGASVPLVKVVHADAAREVRIRTDANVFASFLVVVKREPPSIKQ